MTCLGDLEKIIDEGMDCSDEKNVRIESFLIEGNARRWWMTEQVNRSHSQSSLDKLISTSTTLCFLKDEKDRL